MRHLATLIAAAVIAPAAWLLIAFGQTDSGTTIAKAQVSGAWRAGDLIAPLLLLAGAGILLGLIGTLRFSPLGAVLTGSVYAASYVALLFAGKAVSSLLGYTFTIAGHKADLRTPVVTGTSLLLGALLLVSVASVKRWRRWPVPVTETAPEEGFDNGNTEDTKAFWPTPSPAHSALGSYGSGESNSDRTVPGAFGSAWRTPPGESSAEDRPR
jgi:hypothetical protein